MAMAFTEAKHSWQRYNSAPAVVMPVSTTVRPFVIHLSHDKVRQAKLIKLKSKQIPVLAVVRVLPSKLDIFYFTCFYPTEMHYKSMVS